MISDSIPKASIPMASSNPKDLAKKKRSHRSAKLKQYKLDARREQWLSQVKNKGPKEELNCLGGTCGSVKGVDERPRSIEKLEIIPRGEEDNEGSVNNYSDLDSPANSPTNHPSIVLGGNDSGTNFSGSSGSSSSSSTSSSGQCWSGSMSEEDEEGNDGCLDDWEAIADALASIDENHGSQHNSSLDSHHGRNESVVQSSSQAELLGVDNSKANLETSRPPANCRAWRPDDAFRPQSLPNLSKQYSFPMNSERHYRGGSVWGCRNLSVPTSCPICCEDLDFTDTSFLPCSCGFRLCLFCHKRILEEDGRCPGCRKQYDCDPDEGEAAVDSGSPAIRLARSCSMISRS
ncbi:PREDICTED: uncharacterized protein LOC109149709 [Ipomoea nil]|uniref:uncharacterized protein LOC109149709 n=1 Tax=Ipomoea nil TaxID=35883 RepID=UPI000901550F|nr:PREDICTED: uncharacterized protein LOC109149709 [Ipomoea nil]